MNTHELAGCSTQHLAILEKLNKVAPTDAEVLIIGPSGVGKELYAEYIHEHSHRKANRFVPVNCGSLSSELIQNELFGHVSGAFTGARAQAEGLVKEAEGGTLFLDEVDSLDTPCQIKLLRFLQDKQYRRMGENHLRQSNIRIIAATNTNLENAVTQNYFRKDLFFRLRVVPIQVPALKKRPEDIPELLTLFIEKCAHKYQTPKITVSNEAIQCLIAYDWPGNIRELENCVAYLTCLQLEHPIEVDELQLLNEAVTQSETQPLLIENDTLQSSKRKLIINYEREYIDKILKKTNGNVSAAARLAGKDRRALFELMRKYEIKPDEYRIVPM